MICPRCGAAISSLPCNECGFPMCASGDAEVKKTITYLKNNRKYYIKSILHKSRNQTSKD